MKFSESPGFLNRMANTPGIFERIAFEWQDHIDLTPQWEDCLGLECDEGGFLLHCIEPGLYEVHTLFLPAQSVAERAVESLEILFCQTDCREIVTRVPVNNRAADNLTQKSGFRYRYTRRNGFHGKDGLQDTRHYSITLWDWIIGSDVLEAKGQAFHRGLNAVDPVTHEDDPIHDKFVGYACLCADYGNVRKGVYEYNKWAILSNYQPVSFDGESIRFGNVEIRGVA